MKKMKTILILPLIFLMVFSTSVHVAYSYFDSLETDESVSVLIGEWEDEIETWDSSTRYSKGDIVIYEGLKYIAIKNVPSGKYPIGKGYSKNFWQAQ